MRDDAEFSRAPLARIAAGMARASGGAAHRAIPVPAEALASFVAALGIPAVLGYAKIAGMPLVTGLYTMLLPMAAFAVLGSSRHLVVAADSATAAILAAALTGLGWRARAIRPAGRAGGPADRGMLLAARLPAQLPGQLPVPHRAGRVPDRRRHPGGDRAVPDMLGVTAAGSQTVAKLADTSAGSRSAPGRRGSVDRGHCGRARGSPDQRWHRRIPGLLIAVVSAIIVSYVADLADHGVALVGNVPRGLPGLGLPALAGDAARCSARGVDVRGHPGAERGHLPRLRRRPRGSVQRGHRPRRRGYGQRRRAFSGTFVVNGSPTKPR